MTPDAIFKVVTVGIVPFWLLLILFPKWKWTERIVNTIWIPSVLAAFYIYCQMADAEAPPGAGLTSLEGIRLLFSSEYSMLAAWIHFVVIDFFIGVWEVRDATRNGIKHRWVVPSLVGTFAMAPIGLAFYLIAKAIITRRVDVEKTGSETMPA